MIERPPVEVSYQMMVDHITKQTYSDDPQMNEMFKNVMLKTLEQSADEYPKHIDTTAALAAETK